MNMLSFIETTAVAFQKGGSFMYAIGLVGLIVVLLAIKKFFALYLLYGSIDSTHFMKRLVKFIVSNEMDKAIALCEVKSKNALPYVLLAGLKKSNRTIKDMEMAMEEAGLDIVPRIQKGVSYLSTFANIATLLGLLGTIAGLIMAFSAVAAADPSQKQQMLASGISAAMYTTAFGLIVAIPTLLLYGVFSTKVNSILDDIEHYSTTVMNLFSERYRSVRGADEE